MNPTGSATDLTVEGTMNMKVDALKLELESRRLSKSGVKSELQSRLAMSMGLEMPSNKTTMSYSSKILPNSEADKDHTTEDLKNHIFNEIFALKQEMVSGELYRF